MQFDLKHFPNLHAGNHRDIITETNVAGKFWPANAPRDFNVTSLVVAYESVGFATCTDGSLEPGIEKIAIYSDGAEYMHAARQLETGKWTSKMGYVELI